MIEIEMENHSKRLVVSPENEELAMYMLQKRQEMAETPKGLSENIDMTLSKAYNNICDAKNPIKTLKDLSQVKGVGKWILKLMQEFFETDSGGSEPEDLTAKSKKSKAVKTKGTKRYMPQRNSVAYALLITLYRGTTNGNEFMRKQDLIDAAEASGLSHTPIMPEKGKGKPRQFGSSPRDWYSGWSCMKTLITKGLVVKSSCPAKYMLTPGGREAARECLSRSGFADSIENVVNGKDSDKNERSELDLVLTHPDSNGEVTECFVPLSRKEKSTDVPFESLERFTRMGYSKEQVLQAFGEVSETSQHKEISSLWPAVLCRLREDEVYALHLELHSVREDYNAASRTCISTNGRVDLEGSWSNQKGSGSGGENVPHFSNGSTPSLFTLKACSSSDYDAKWSRSDDLKTRVNLLSVPPLSFGERFEDAYEVVLILDDREQFAVQGSRSRRIIENVCSQFKIQMEVRRLPVGDGIWIARHRQTQSEYVLDFIVERKKVDDLRSSIRDNRYRDQKLRLVRCGLKKLIYLVEGDPNSSEAAESIKTACFTTEILEGFDVQRTSGLADTLRKYGYITQAITEYYKVELPEDQLKCAAVCPPFDEFLKRCQDLDKMTVSDVFAVQLMQVPQVTEEIAITVLDLYPTLLSLAHAYSILEGDVCAQEEMLWKQSNNAVSASASRNIFQLVWGK
ncbi:Crossover junction endonuclease MUS81 [Citrus sinensis]|uniref:crossover junction endonuclease MUS81 isoform X1 n=1 Tax=Citrus sinensis TaxID=2711 RepID=UPI0003D791A8|nr:crossover junction endonuclease MUS81 isoform X1 [Citrus sinensis]KAH9709914.1 Crossover junction endonuclease MUS81 [Citrus sinensis]